MITHKLWSYIFSEVERKYYGMIDSFEVFLTVLLTLPALVLDLILSPFEIIAIVVYKFLIKGRNK